MRHFVKDTVSEQDALKLVDFQSNQSRHDFDEIASQVPSFKRLMDLIEDILPEKPIWNAPSYFRIENRPKLHHQHYDGCTLDMKPNHMAWCRYSAVSVLTDGWTDGTLRFHNPVEELNQELYLSTIVYSSAADNDPQLHERENHDGSRYALLIFLATENT